MKVCNSSNNDYRKCSWVFIQAIALTVGILLKTRSLLLILWLSWLLFTQHLNVDIVENK